jgi:enoyl-[acyl-carrier protein] reductase I
MLLKGKKGLLVGLSNDRCISWGVAQACVAEGAELCIAYHPIMKKRVLPLAEKLNAKTIECDVADEESVKRVFEFIGSEWGVLDFMLHAVAFSDKNELRGRFSNTTHSNFQNTMTISCFSLISIAKYARPLLNKSEDGGSIVALTHLGSERAMPNYNIMGVAKAGLEASVRYLALDLGAEKIRVNAISSGPIRTLAASGIEGFNLMLRYNELNSPLRYNVTIEDNGKTALYLLSNMSSGVTGEVLYLDGGYHIMGMKNPDTPHI